MSTEKRSAEPATNCEWTYGVAYTKVIREDNLDHLKDVKDSMCVASPNSCTRVAYLDESGIFFCNDNHQPIITECENLIDPVKKLSEACTYGDHYTFGVLDGKIKNGTAEVSYHLRIAAGGF
ncbi:hypothetical protein PENNAL_c0108G06761 [Penicillium nalgiovense]|uniref:Uncharacterized protein n=1 Tax=Penicillium nalgiovense TaxID=60175 RepID=A0A1V6X811_PENNA|nr:hypothetical protein PENNAL_c0108G06761 [Penicillium nalgiovense]